MRRFVAVAIALSLLTSSVAGCSQPIDTGSSVPAQSQPIVALLALLGLGIGLTAWHHHNEAHHGGGGVTLVPPVQIIGPLISGDKATDLANDPTDIGLGVLESPVASGAAHFALVSGNTFTSYALPTGYNPVALTVDPNTGDDWFVDAAGKVQGCLPPSPGVVTCSTSGLPVPTFNDGLGAGDRSIVTDGSFVFVALDAGGGSVKWFAFALSDGTTTSSSYSSQSTTPLYPTDFAISTPQAAASGFTVFHSDGHSDLVTIPPSNVPSFTFAPAPLKAPSNVVLALDGVNQAFYAPTGSVAGTYNITRYTNQFDSGIGQLKTLSITIASNGQTGQPFSPPLTSVHVDTSDQLLDGIDASGNIVEFAQF